MSMPAKGKHHHLSHHHQQQQHHPHQQQQQQQHHPQQQQTHQHPQQQQQHVNVNQSGVTNTPQAYNAVVAANTRYVTHAERETVNGRRNLPAGMAHPFLDFRWARHGNSIFFRSPGSEFHVSGQNYVAQPGGHVGGGGGSVGVPGGRGPPSLGGIQSINQTTAGIQPGGPPTGQQQPPQAQTPGVQQQQSQGSAPTTTPPVHTPSPQEMGKQAHLPAQPPLQQVYVSNQTRPVSQTYFQPGPRPQQPRGLGHRGGQGGGGTQVVGMPGGGSSQPTGMYTHQSIPVPQGATMYVPSQVPPLHPGSHQPAMYPLMPLFSATPQRHQGHHGQPFYPQPYTSVHVAPQNVYSYQPQGAQHPYYGYPPPTAPMNLSRASANAVSGGAQHVGGPLAGAQGAGGVPQGPLQQPSQQPQPIPPMAIPLPPTEVYTGHNGGTSNAGSTRPPKAIRANAIMDIVNPETGTNISHVIYGNAAAASVTSSNRETPQPQNPELVADFAARVAKAASEASEASSPVPPSLASGNASSSAPIANFPSSVVSSAGQDHATSQSSSSITNLKIQTNSTKDPSSQCNTGPSTPTQNAANLVPAIGAQQQQQQPQQTLNSASSIAPAIAQVDSCPISKPESKPLQFVAQEFRPRGEIKTVSPVVIAAEEQHRVVASPPVAAALVNKANIPVAQPEPVAALPVASTIPIPKTEQSELPKSAAAAVASAAPPPSLPVNASTVGSIVNVTNTNVSESRSHPSNTAAQATAAPQNVAPIGINVPAFPGPLPTRPRPTYAAPADSFPSLSAKSSSSSPPRRKTNHQQQQQQQQQAQTASAAVATSAAAELPPSGKDQHKERKISDRSTGASRGTTPTPSHNQTEQHHQRSNGETASEKSDSASEGAIKGDHHHQKSGDGKAMPKAKKQSKLKHKDLNRRGAEKEGTDMDAFVNAAAASKQESKTQHQENKGQSAQALPPTKDSNVAETCPARDSAKVIKERENNETKVESSDPDSGKAQKGKNLSKPEVSKEASAALPPVSSPAAPAQDSIVDDLPQQQTAPTIQQNHKEPVSKESTPTIEDSSKSSQGVCSMPTKTLPNDVVDHSPVIAKDENDVEAIVAQKNEENAKVSALHATLNENKASTDDPVIEKESENETPNENDASSAPPPLKYTYKEDQWSPRNVTGKKEYGREFLMRLQLDPKSRIRPQHLPELDVVLKECIKIRYTEFRPFKDPNLGRHDALFPGFAKSNYNNAKVPLLTKKSYQGKSKAVKPNVIHVTLSLREDVKLRETENAWRPARLKPQTSAEEDAAADKLYKKVRSVLNKLTPQKFDTLVSQVRALEIDTQEKLQGVIDLVFEKAVDEPNFSVAYALMCKELALIKVLTDDAKKAQENNNGENAESGPQNPPAEVNFRKLIIERCQMQFQKNTDDEAARIIKLKEIEDCTDPEKKKELQATLEEDERRLRVRSVGNIRFIGELFKKEMLTTKIMHFCIMHLLSNPDEENLECLCKLLTTIGKVLESKTPSNHDGLAPYFTQLTELAGKRSQRKISSRIRFMIQDVIDLRNQNWVPRRDENKPKTMDQIQKEAECERSDVQLNNTPMNTPRKDDRNNDRRRNRGGGNSGMEEGGWSQPVGKTRQQPYSVETSKLSTKPPPPDEMRLGSRHTYAWGAQSAATNKYALLDSDMDRRQPLQVSGSRSTGPREYGRSDYKPSWEIKGSRMSSHQMNSGVSSREALMKGGRSQSVSMPPPQMKIKPQPTSTVATGSTSSLSSVSSNKPQKTQDELIRIVTSMIDGAPCEPNVDLFIKNAMEQIEDAFDSSSYELFVREAINGVLERTAAVRNQFSSLFSHLVNNKVLPLSLIQTQFQNVLDIAEDLVIDIPKVWTYLAEILANMVVTNAHPLSEIKTTAAVLKERGTGGKLMGELLSKLQRDQGPKWVADKWDQSGLQWSDITDTKLENIDEIIKKYKLEFLNGECKSSDIASSGSQLTNEQIQEHLAKLMRESNFDYICSWILANVGSRVTEPQFIRVLTTAILDVTVEERYTVWKLNENLFKNLQTLIKRFIADVDADLELQCLFAIQAYVHKLEHPHGLLFSILTSLQQNDILSDDAFLTWESHTGEFPGHAVAIKGLTSFFTGLREPDSDDA